MVKTDTMYSLIKEIIRQLETEKIEEPVHWNPRQHQALLAAYAAERRLLERDDYATI